MEQSQAAVATLPDSCKQTTPTVCSSTTSVALRHVSRGWHAAANLRVLRDLVMNITQPQGQALYDDPATFERALARLLRYGRFHSSRSYLLGPLAKGLSSVGFSNNRTLLVGLLWRRHLVY